MIVSTKIALRLLPWILLTTIIFTLYLTNHWPFGSGDNDYQDVIESTTFLERIERLGKLELVKYNYKEVFEYKRLSDGKIIGNAILNTTNYDPDISVILIASGEAVGCIDLMLMQLSDIHVSDDSVVVTLPAPELCYYKLNLDDTKVYSLSESSWWSKLFSDSDEENEVLQMAYQKAEQRISEAALESGIYRSVNEQATLILKPLLEEVSGKSIMIETTLPAVQLSTAP